MCVFIVRVYMYACIHASMGREFSLIANLSFVLQDDRPRVSSVVSLFLLAQVFLIVSHAPLVRALAKIIFHADNSIFSEDTIVLQVICFICTDTSEFGRLLNHLNVTYIDSLLFLVFFIFQRN